MHSHVTFEFRLGLECRSADGADERSDVSVPLRMGFHLPLGLETSLALRTPVRFPFSVPHHVIAEVALQREPLETQLALERLGVFVLMSLHVVFQVLMAGKHGAANVAFVVATRLVTASDVNLQLVRTLEPGRTLRTRVRPVREVSEAMRFQLRLQLETRAAPENIAQKGLIFRVHASDMIFSVGCREKFRRAKVAREFPFPVR